MNGLQGRESSELRALVISCESSALAEIVSGAVVEDMMYSL